MKSLIMIVLCGLLLIISQGFLSYYRGEAVEKESDLYLPEVSYLKFISLGHNELTADLVLAKALTYFGSHYYEREYFGFKHLRKLFFTALEMDPMNKDAFLMAGNILSGIDIQQSIDILKLGMRYHPDYWKFPEMIGYRYFFNLNNSLLAAKYYEIAARLPGHPPYVPSLSDKFYRESGRYEQAIRVLYNFYSTTTDKRLKDSFKKSIEAIQEKIKNKEFSLKAKVLNIIDVATIQIQPDHDNLQFQSLKSNETVHIPGIKSYDVNSFDVKEKMFAYFQQEFAQLMLTEKDVRIDFLRDSNGELLRNEKKQLLGTITLKYDRDYRKIALESGIMMDLEKFPPPGVSLDRDAIYQQVGKVISLEFNVNNLKVIDGNIFLNSASAYRNIFSVIIPHQFIARFSGTDVKGIDFLRQLVGKHITVSGFAGISGKRVEIKVYFPIQLRTNT